MLFAAQRRSPKDAQKLATLRTRDGFQPIHYAESVDCLQLLLEFKAELDAKTNDGRTILHTVTAASVIDYVFTEQDKPDWGDKPRMEVAEGCCGITMEQLQIFRYCRFVFLQQSNPLICVTLSCGTCTRLYLWSHIPYAAPVLA